jgi:hypothetical protein
VFFLTIGVTEIKNTHFLLEILVSDKDLAALGYCKYVVRVRKLSGKELRDSTIRTIPCGLRSLTHPLDDSPSRTLEVYRTQICIFYPS